VQTKIIILDFLDIAYSIPKAYLNFVPHFGQNSIFQYRPLLNNVLPQESQNFVSLMFSRQTKSTAGMKKTITSVLKPLIQITNMVNKTHTAETIQGCSLRFRETFLLKICQKKREVPNITQAARKIITLLSSFITPPSK